MQERQNFDENYFLFQSQKAARIIYLTKDLFCIPIYQQYKEPHFILSYMDIKAVNNV